jgi:AcrR family transcriptional regulator
VNRVATQAANRAKILTAARAQFAARGFAAVKIDEIAAEVDLTRGAVYSNCPGHRALYFEVLAAETPETPPVGPPASLREALSAFAMVTVAQATPLARDLMPQILAEESSRTAYAHLLRLDAVLLGLHLERVQPVVLPPFRRVRMASMALTVVQGASQLHDISPSLVEPFDVISACEALAELELNDAWAPTELAATSVAWTPPPAVDLLTGAEVDLDDVTFLGMHRLADAEEVARRHSTVVIVPTSPEERALVRLNLGRLPLGPVGVRIVCDENGEIARAAGVAVGDRTLERVRSASWERSGARPGLRVVPS